MKKNCLIHALLVVSVLMVFMPIAKAEKRTLPKLFQLHIEQPNLFKFKKKKKKTKIETNEIKAETDEVKSEKKPLVAKVWKVIKGEPVQDSILLGMYSLHTSHKKNERNDTNNILALQYKGISVGTFTNSYYNQSYYATFARKLFEKEIAKDLNFDLQYKLGVLHGYRDKYPNIGGTSPVLLPTIGITYKGIGADFWIIPAEKVTFSFNFRIDIPKFKKKTKTKKSL